eukprot:1137222-Pelagomonas_calceolata.AAC.4
MAHLVQGRGGVEAPAAALLVHAAALAGAAACAVPAALAGAAARAVPAALAHAAACDAGEMPHRMRPRLANAQRDKKDYARQVRLCALRRGSTTSKLARASSRRLTGLA